MRKDTNRIRKWASVGIAALALAFSAGSATAQCVASDDGSGVQVFNMIAGQQYYAGTIQLQVEGDYLMVTYATEDGWELDNLHLWVGSSLTDLPHNGPGQPVPGHFPYKVENIRPATEYTFAVPLTELNFSCPGDDVDFYIAAHADVHGSYGKEGAWSEGPRIVPRGNWAMYSTFSLTCDCEDVQDPNENGCETAFAYSDPENCFLNWGFSRWGWFNGPIADGDFMDFYAGAGQCDTDKGTLVGGVVVMITGNVATVTIMTDDGFGLKETHLYVGQDRFPKSVNGTETVAPGQYPYMHENLNGATVDQYEVTIDPEVDYNIIVHGIVCGSY